MRGVVRVVGVLVVGAALSRCGTANLAPAAGDAGSDNGSPDVTVVEDGGTTDAGTAHDAGSRDAGTHDAGTDAGPGDSGPLPVSLPTAADWTFYGPANGGPNTLFGASFDEGGNLWVAGGEEGLFVLRAGETRYQRFTMADGLRPYGFMADGSVPPGDKYLKVISVSGAWAGTVFVGYQGKPPAGGALDCESNWDGPNPDPAIYKSGDADRVTLNGTAISVVHYDIFSGPGIVGGELRGREKVCNIVRIRYDKANDKVWFGGNHGFALGEAHYAGNGSCQWAASTTPPTPTMKTDPFSNDYGHKGCNGVLEHVHPALNVYAKDGSCCAFLTNNYYGVSVDPVTKDVWFAGYARTTKFHFASNGGDYFKSQSETEDPPYASNRIDIWPDKVQEPNIPTVADRVDDNVSGAAAMNDGSVWITSFSFGLAHLDASGGVTARLTAADGLVATKLSAIVADPADQSVWLGPNFGGGLSRLHSGAVTSYDHNLLGWDLANEGVADLQAFGAGSGRKIVVTFMGDTTHAGAVGIYSGQ
jgi:hypothetical protein